MKKASHNDAHTALVHQCLAYLTLRGVFCWKQNTGAMKIGNRFVRFAQAGTPDILAVVPPSGRLLAIECKTGRGQLNKAQIAWQGKAAQAGARVVVIHDVRALGPILDVERWGR